MPGEGKWSLDGWVGILIQLSSGISIGYPCRVGWSAFEGHLSQMVKSAMCKRLPSAEVSNMNGMGRS